MIKIIISTCYKYKDVLLISLKGYEKSGIKAKFYVISDFEINFGSLNIDVKNIFFDRDIGWIESIKFILNDFQNDELIILSMDDLVPEKFIGNKFLSAFYKYALAENVDALKLYEPPSHRIQSSIEKDFCNINSSINDPYPISTMFSLYKVSFLKYMLENAKDAWDFELNSKKLLPEKSKILSSPFNIVDFRNTVIRGQIIPSRIDDSNDSSSRLKKISSYGLAKHYTKIILSFLSNTSLIKIIKFLIH